MSDDPTVTCQQQTPASIAGVFQEVEDQLAAEARTTYDAATGLARIIGGEQERADRPARRSRKYSPHEESAMPMQVELRVHDDVALGEIELYAEVLTAVAQSDGPLAREELDEALGVGRKDAQDESGPGSRPGTSRTAKPSNQHSTEDTPLAR
jgi:hypothetical protein